MKRMLTIWVLAATISSLAFSQAKEKRVGQNKVVSNRKAEQEILKMEEELVKAGLLGDAVSADRLMAADYFFMTRDGVVHENLKAALLVRMRSGQSKTTLLEGLNSNEINEPLLNPTTVAETQVHVYGDTGVIIVRSTYQTRSKDGTVTVVPTRFLHVWGRRQGRWQLVAGSSTRIQQPTP